MITIMMIIMTMVIGAKTAERGQIEHRRKARWLTVRVATASVAEPPPGTWHKDREKGQRQIKKRRRNKTGMLTPLVEIVILVVEYNQSVQPGTTKTKDNRLATVSRSAAAWSAARPIDQRFGNQRLVPPRPQPALRRPALGPAPVLASNSSSTGADVDLVTVTPRRIGCGGSSTPLMPPAVWPALLEVKVQ